MKKILSWILSVSFLMLSVLPVHAESLSKEYVLVYRNASVVEHVDMKYHLHDKKTDQLNDTISVVFLTGIEKKQIEKDLNVKTLVENIECRLLAQSLTWNITMVGADSAWQGGVTGLGVKVAVIDTGIYLNHPDLAANIKGGYNAINPKKSANDDNGHGTHVAGIIAAINNNIGVVGVAPQASLYAVKVLSASGTGTLAGLIKGIQWAIDHDMDVINMSLGFGSATEEQLVPLHDVIISAINENITVVAAAGNDSTHFTELPGRYPEVFSVAAVDSARNLAYFNSTGKIDFSAPGVYVYSTYKKSYATLSGTSMATPHVAGAAALIISLPSSDLDLDGSVEPSEVKSILASMARDLASPGFDDVSGWGLIDVSGLH
jgi:subtilisin